MKILIAGASGFVGQYLVNYWRNTHQIYALGRDAQKIIQAFPEGVQALTWDKLLELNPDDFDVVINLAGETINHLRWTKAVKQRILQSRIQATERLARWCCMSQRKQLHFLSTSALSIYGLFQQMPQILPTETTLINPHQEFLFQVAQKWESAAQKIAECGLPLTIMRFSIVLAKNQGALPKLTLPASLGLAGRVGTGQQPFSWISIYDLVKAVDFIISERVTGPVNMVAPEVVTQFQFTQSLAKKLHRPCFMFTPAWLLRLSLGEMADEMLLSGLGAQPQKLMTHGFQFKDPDVGTVLRNLGSAYM